MVLAALTLSKVGAAQVYFSVQIDWEHEFEYLSSVLLKKNSEQLFVAGGSENFSGSNRGSLLASLTSEGLTNWQKKYWPMSGVLGTTYHATLSADNSAFLLGNYEKPIAGGNYDKQIFLTKANLETGETLWTREYGFSNYTEQGWTVKPLGDGGVLLSGTAFLATSTGPSNMLFMRTDSLGNLVFRKEYTTDADKYHYAFSFAPTPDGGYLLYGYRSYWGHYLGGFVETNMLDMVLIKTDADGNEQWSKVYPPWEWKQHLFYGLDIQPVSGEEFLISGLKAYKGANAGGEYFFARINAQGEIVDSVTLPKLYYSFRVNRLKPCSDGNFWAIGAEKDSQNLGQTGLIMKISPELEVLWKREYRVSPSESTMHEMFYEGVEMPDKGFALCGTAFGPLEDSTWQNGWVIRVDSLGCLEPGCQLNSAIEDPPAPEQDIGVTLAPNPTSGQARLALAHEGAVLLGVRVLDLQGRVVSDMQYLRSVGWRECVVDLGGESAGVYVVQVRSSEGWGMRKIVKQ